MALDAIYMSEVLRLNSGSVQPSRSKLALIILPFPMCRECKAFCATSPGGLCPRITTAKHPQRTENALGVTAPQPARHLSRYERLH